MTTEAPILEEQTISFADEFAEEPTILGGLIADMFKLFFSDHNVIAAIIVSAVAVTLLIIAANFLRGRW